MNTSNKKIYTITEYSSFTRNIEMPGYQLLPKGTFDALENYLLSQDENKDSNVNEILSLSYHKNLGKIITAKNYVGILTMTDGTVIEILPKIVGKGVTPKESRKILLQMLQTVNDVNFKESNFSNLDTNRLNLYEIFIQMFLEEVVQLTKTGIKSSYSIVEENEHFYKEKLKVSENLKHNLFHKERFYVQYDDFNPNRPENRLIKSTLHLLSKITRDSKNQQLIMQLFSNFNKVDFSRNYDADFSKSIINRSTKHYEKVLSWCRIFLKGLSFTTISGDEVASALLFPMERLFESYVAFMIQKVARNREFQIRTQDDRYSLFSHPRKTFTLRPDIVLKSENQTIVMDTKWKILSDTIGNKGISQADMYQMYAYGKKYNADSVILLYPFSDAVENTELYYLSSDGVHVEVQLVDLRNALGSIRDMLESIFEW